VGSVDQRLNQATASLSPEQRLRGWLERMEQAKGLDFVLASDDARFEVVVYETTDGTPRGRAVAAQLRQRFGRLLGRRMRSTQLTEVATGEYGTARDTVLKMNTLAREYFEVHWAETLATLGRIAMLLSLSVMQEDAAVRKRVERRVAQAKGRRRATAESEAEPNALGEFVRHMNVMFIHDTPALNRYWLETLGVRAWEFGDDDDRKPIDIADVLTKGEAVLRPLHHYYQRLHYNLAEPLLVLEALLAEKIPGVRTAAKNCLLQPVPRYRDRNEAILKVLEKSSWMDAASEFALSEAEVQSLREAMRSKESSVPQVVYRYRRWVDGAEEGEEEEYS